MRLTKTALRRFGEHLNGGALVLYSGSMPSEPDADIFPNVLVECELPYPAFVVVKESGRLALNGPVEATIARSGDVGWAQLLEPTREVLADLVVKAEDADDATTADLLVDRTDLQRGGRCTITRLTLTLPR